VSAQFVEARERRVQRRLFALALNKIGPGFGHNFGWGAIDEFRDLQASAQAAQLFDQLL